MKTPIHENKWRRSDNSSFMRAATKVKEVEGNSQNQKKEKKTVSSLTQTHLISFAGSGRR